MAVKNRERDEQTNINRIGNKTDLSDSPADKQRLSIAYQNPDGIEKKAEILNRNILAADYDIIIMSETWLGSADPSVRFFPSNYDVHRLDRENTKIKATKGGGVLIAVADELDSNRIYLDDLNGFLEYVAVEIKLPAKKMIVYNAYIRPKTIDKVYECMRQQIFDAHMKNVQTLCQNTGDTVLIIGDFNLPKITWSVNEEGSNLLPNYDKMVNHNSNEILRCF